MISQVNVQLNCCDVRSVRLPPLPPSIARPAASQMPGVENRPRRHLEDEPHRPSHQPIIRVIQRLSRWQRLRRFFAGPGRRHVPHDRHFHAVDRRAELRPVPFPDDACPHAARRGDLERAVRDLPATIFMSLSCNCRLFCEDAAGGLSSALGLPSSAPLRAAL